VELSTINILCTRLLEAALIEEAAAKGITIQAIPFIEISLLNDDAAVEKIQELCRRRATAIFTSVNAVEAVGRGWKTGPVWDIFCTGWATRERAAALFGGDAIAGTADSAQELAELILQRKGMADGAYAVAQDAGEDLFFFCGDQRRDELPVLLRQHGIRVNEQIVYRTVLTPVRLPEKFDGVVFFSPSAVESFFSMNSAAAGTRMFAIGSTTAEAIKRSCDNSVTISSRPEKETLIREMIDFYETNDIFY
jgi:uroporphyrinogen-III synthase